MRLARVLGAIGRGLISAGVIVLLFVAYQLWGTGLQQTAAQGDLGSDFEQSTGTTIESTDTASLEQLASESLEARSNPQSAADAELTNATGEDGTESDGATGAGLVEGNFSAADQDIVASLYPDAGEAFARIIIPSINVDQITVEGVSVEDLRKGPGHYRTTPNPGQAGNAAIAGHRTTYGAPFHRVDELEPGDPIFVTTAQGVFKYEVLGFENPAGGPDLGYFIVSPSDTWVLDQKKGENILTLTACHPKYSARQRIIVQAELVGEPAPTIPRDEALDLGEVTLESGATDERAQEAPGVDGAIADDGQVIISDAAAADDDPTVDAEGNPIEPVADGTDEDSDDETAAAGASDSNSSNGGVDSTNAEEAVTVSAENSELVSAQSPLSTDDFGEGLNGDSTKVKPAIMWGISGLMIWLAAWFMGNQLDRKWTLYAVGLVPFVVVLWSTFLNVDQALPSY